MLSNLDDFIHTISVDIVTDFVEVILPFLTEVISGSRKNWRHDVFIGEVVIIDGKRIMKHHLMHYAVDTADFSSDVIDAVMELMAQFNSGKIVYNQNVLMPTILLWIMIVLAELNTAEAKFYLSNGGKHNQDIAYKNLERKTCK